MTGKGVVCAMGEHMPIEKAENSSSGIGIGTVLFLIFLVLKLIGAISWSWWWVFSPIWIPILLVVVIGGLIALFD